MQSQEFLEVERSRKFSREEIYYWKMLMEREAEVNQSQGDGIMKDKVQKTPCHWLGGWRKGDKGNTLPWSLQKTTRPCNTLTAAPWDPY